MSLIRIVDGELQLDSGILEENFGKMSFSQIIKEEGILVRAKKENDEYKFIYETWTFSAIKTFDVDNRRTVFYCGAVNFFSDDVKTLLEFFDDEKFYEAGRAVILCLTNVAKTKREIPLNGAGGIFVELTDEGFTILFSPHELFMSALGALTESEKSVLHTQWINLSLADLNAIRFLRASIAYRILTGHVAYPESNEIERNADILDGKFLPLEYCLQGVGEILSEKINNELLLNNAFVSIPGKKEKKSIAQKILDSEQISGARSESRAKDFSERYFNVVSDFPVDLLDAEHEKIGRENKKISDDEFKIRADEFLKKQNKKIKTKRIVRRNFSKIVTIAIVSVVFIIAVINFVKSNGNVYTSRGLSSEETVEAFFMSINNLDVTFIDALVKGSKANQYANIVNSIYVIGKNRQTYGNDKGFLNPAAYFLFVTDSEKVRQAGLYGISNLCVNGKEQDMEQELHLRKEKPAKIEFEGGKQIQNKMKTTQTAEYYVIHSEGVENTLFVEHHVDEIILTFLKDKWIITEINQTVTDVKFDSNEFMENYFSMLEFTEGNQVQATQLLQIQYPWLPTKIEMENQAAKEEAKRLETLRMFGQIE